MIKIEFEGATGAEIRSEMMALLGLDTLSQPFIATIEDEDLQTVITRNSATSAPVETPATTEEKPKPATRQRKPKDAVAEANTGAEEPPASESNVDGSKKEDDSSDTAETPAEQSGITAEMLTSKAVELGRKGFRDNVFAVLNDKFGGATIAKKDGKPQLTADQYPAVMEAFNAIA